MRESMAAEFDCDVNRILAHVGGLSPSPITQEMITEITHIIRGRIRYSDPACKQGIRQIRA